MFGWSCIRKRKKDKQKESYISILNFITPRKQNKRRDERIDCSNNRLHNELTISLKPSHLLRGHKHLSSHKKLINNRNSCYPIMVNNRVQHPNHPLDYVCVNVNRRKSENDLEALKLMPMSSYPKFPHSFNYVNFNEKITSEKVQKHYQVNGVSSVNTTPNIQKRITRKTSNLPPIIVNFT